MADIGNPVDLGGFNARLGDAAVTAKHSALLNEELWSWIASLGPDQPTQEATIATRFAVDTATAHRMWLRANYLHALGGCYFGANAAGPFNYNDALADVRGINS